MKRVIYGKNILDTASDVLHSIFKMFDKMMESDRDGMKYKEKRNVKEKGVPGVQYIYEVGDGELLEVYLFTIQDHPDEYMIRINSDNAPEFKTGPITREDIDELVTKYAEKYDLGYGIEDSIDVNSSKYLSNDLIVM